MSSENWQPIQEASLGDEVEWSDGGTMRHGHIVLAPNNAEALECCESEPDEMVHDMILVVDFEGSPVWLEDGLEPPIFMRKKRESQDGT